jgi:hypothetical protein
MTRPFLAIWPATGRWRVRQYLAPHGGPMGTPQLRYAVIDPAGLHVGSATQWQRAQDVAQDMARGELEALGKTTGR